MTASSAVALRSRVSGIGGMRLTGDFIVRAAALAAVLVVAIVAAVLLLGGPGGGYTVKANFQNAAQLVKGNLVQTGGAPVGKVSKLDLTPDGQAQVTLKIKDDYAPLRRGTLATVRQASLSGVANRYIDLRMAPQRAEKIPDGGVIGQDSTTTAVDLDQVFNTFDPETRKALQGVIKGSAGQFKGKGKEFNEGIAYLNPSLAASSRLFRELNRDTPLLERFIVSSSQLVTDIADRHDDLSGLVDDLATTTTAIGNQNQALSDAIGRLPDFERRANTTFVNLRAALDDLDPLVEGSKPVAKKLRPFLAELRPLARDARPTGHDLSKIASRPRRPPAARPRRPPDRQRPLEDRQPPRPGQRPDRADEAAAAAARRHHPQGQRQRQAARRRVQGLAGRAQGQHAGVRVLPPLHARPARLVRRLQPLRRL